MVIEGVAFWRALGHENGVPMNEISVLKKATKEKSLDVSTM